MNFWIIFRPGFTVNRRLIQILSLSLIVMLLFSITISGSSCKKNTETGITADEGIKEESVSDNNSSDGTNSTVQTSTSESSSTSSSDETISQSASETETTAEIIPQEITDLIIKADGYYISGEYDLASKTYKNAEMAIKGSELSEETQQQQMSLFAAKYKKAKDITDTARMHYGNAMTLEYEQRFEEAKKELEAALSIYPKYKDAIDAYETLKAMMGLE